MALYLILLGIYIIVGLLELFGILKFNTKIRILLLIIPLLLMVGFRDVTVGNDTISYYEHYIRVSKEPLFSPSKSNMEIGYIFFIRLFGIFDASYFHFQLFVSTFIYFCLYKFILKYSRLPATSIMFFLGFRMFFQSMNVLRHFIAFSILLLSIDYLFNKKFFKFVMMILIAMLFHKSSVIFIIAYPVYHYHTLFRRYKTVLNILILFGFLSVLIFFDTLVIHISKILGYESYIYGEYFQVEGKFGIYILALYYLFFFALTILLNKKERANIRNLIYIIIFMAMLGIIGLNTSIMKRFISYFYMFYMIYIPELLLRIKQRDMKLFTYLTIALIVSLYYVIPLIYRPEWNRVIPYKFYF